MTLILLNALLPIFVGLLLGYLAGRRGVVDNLNVRNLMVLVMDFAIPCALFPRSAAHPCLCSENNRNPQ
jgi:predicted permease